jgi:hypothetical protein
MVIWPGHKNPLNWQSRQSTAVQWMPPSGRTNGELRLNAAGLISRCESKYNDIIWWPTGSNWKNQSLTVNTSVRDIYSLTAMYPGGTLPL